jgi:hypothetical protein
MFMRLRVEVQPGTEPIPLGSCLALFRLTEHGVEACAAVLQVISDRPDGQGLQAEVRWMSAHHRPVFQKGQVNKNSLRVRVVNGEALTLVEKSTGAKLTYKRTKLPTG